MRFILLVLILLLAGCAETFNPQAFSGIAKINIQFNDSGQIVSIDSIEGKEFGLVEVTLTNSDGSVITINEQDVTAFNGQEIQQGLLDFGLPELDSDVLNAILAIINRGKTNELESNLF